MFVRTGNFSLHKDGDGELFLDGKFLMDIPNLSSPWLALLWPLLGSIRHAVSAVSQLGPPPPLPDYSAQPTQQQTEAHLSNPNSFAPYLSALPLSDPRYPHPFTCTGWFHSGCHGIMCKENEVEHEHKRMSRENGAYIVKE
jgi:hypothetical protein